MTTEPQGRNLVLDALHSKYYQRLVRFCASCNPGLGTAEDVASETFLLAVEKWESDGLAARPEDELWRWLLSTARKKSFEEFRRHKKTRLVPDDDPRAAFAGSRAFRDETFDRFRQHWIETLLGGLRNPGRTGKIFRLFEPADYPMLELLLRTYETGEKFSYEHAAESLNISQDAARQRKSRMARAKQTTGAGSKKTTHAGLLFDAVFTLYVVNTGGGCAAMRGLVREARGRLSPGLRKDVAAHARQCAACAATRDQHMREALRAYLPVPFLAAAAQGFRWLARHPRHPLPPRPSATMLRPLTPATRRTARRVAGHGRRLFSAGHVATAATITTASVVMVAVLHPAQAGTEGTELSRIAAELRQSSDARSAVTRATQDVGNCTMSAADGIRLIRDAIRERDAVLLQLQASPTSAIPGGKIMSADLEQVLRLSVRADQNFIGWMEDSQRPCARSAAQDTHYQAAMTASYQATTAKQDFLAHWNPLADQYGQPAFTASAI
jgi:hypothetical protein